MASLMVSISLCLTMAASLDPPMPFWQFNSLGRASAPTSSEPGQFPNLFWSYYGQEVGIRPSLTYGGYSRHSPDSWRGSYDSSHIRGVIEVSPDDDDDDFSILRLSSRPKISHGPRRRKRWTQSSYIDPLFGIPLAHPPPSTQTRANTLSKRKWKPYCPTDCRRTPRTQCCLQHQVDRFFPIGPYVQPSLVENWMSALFQLFGNDPLVYIAAKKFLVLAVIAAGFAAWAALGHAVGFIRVAQPRETAQDRMDTDDLTTRVALAVSDGNSWLQELSNSLENDTLRNSVGKFFCCFVGDNTMECYRKESGQYQKKFSSALDCVSSLMYDISVDKDDND